MKIHDAEAATDEGPYPICGNIAPNFKALAGVTVGPGWRRAIAERVGGIRIDGDRADRSAAEADAGRSGPPVYVEHPRRAGTATSSRPTRRSPPSNTRR